MWNELRDWIKKEIRLALHEINYPMNLGPVKAAASEAETLAQEAVGKLTASVTASSSADSSSSTGTTSPASAPGSEGTAP